MRASQGQDAAGCGNGRLSLSRLPGNVGRIGGQEGGNSRERGASGERKDTAAGPRPAWMLADGQIRERKGWIQSQRLGAILRREGDE